MHNALTIDLEGCQPIFRQPCLCETPWCFEGGTMACTITAKKLGIKVAHVEAGLRSRDMSMPEEINRLCTDVLCDYLFTTDHFARENLKAEGTAADKIYFVGNGVIDTLFKHKELARGPGLIEQWGLKPRRFATVTLQRTSNVDDPVTLRGILDALISVAEHIPLIFPITSENQKDGPPVRPGRVLFCGGPAPGSVDDRSTWIPSRQLPERPVYLS